MYPNAQSNPAGAIPVYQGATSVAVVTASGQVKTGAGVLQGVNLGTAGSGATVSFYDGDSDTGKLLWSFSADAMPYDTKPGVPYATGLYVSIVASTSPSVNITYI